MGMVNPNDKKYDSGRIEGVGEGEGDFVVLGFELVTINGKPALEVRSICIQADRRENEGCELRDLFFLHDKALGRFVKFVKDGMGWTEPFDPEDPSYIAKITGKRPFRAAVKVTRNGNYDRHDCGWSYRAPRLEYDQVSGKYVLTDVQRAHLLRGQKAWEGYQKWRAANPRDGSGGGAGAGRGSSNSGGGGGGSGSGRDDLDDYGYGSSSGSYDDIPF